MANEYSPQEIQEILSAYAKAQSSGEAVSKDLSDAMSNATEATKQYNYSLKSGKDQLKDSLKGLGESMINGESGAQVYNNTINAGAKVAKEYFDKIPGNSGLLGKSAEALAKVENAIAKQADATYASYQKLSRSGLAIGMDSAFKNLQDAGYTMKEIGQYGDLMKQNSETLATMSGTAEEGATRFAQISKQIINSPLKTQLGLLGNEVGDINSGIANYIKFQQLSGQVISNDDKQVAAASAEFIVQQDRVTKLTGISADEQNKLMQGALASQQYSAKEMLLKEEAAKYAGTARGDKAKNQLMMNAVILAKAQTGGAETVKNAQMFLAGANNTEGAQQFQRGFSNLADYIHKGGTDIDQANTIMAADAKKSTTNQNQLAIAGVYDKTYGPFAENLKIAASGTEKLNGANARATKDINAQTSGGDKTTAGMVNITNNQRDATKSMEQTLNQGMPVVTAGLAKMAEAGDDVTALFNGISGKQGTVGGGPTGFVDRAKALFGFGSPPAAGGASGGQPTAPGASGSNTDAMKLISFTGGSGSRSNFDDMSAKVKNAFLAMVSEYGQPVTINSAKRTSADQERLYNTWKAAGGDYKTKPTAAGITIPTPPGGTDSHMEGRAIDLDHKSYDSMVGLLGKYGFVPVRGDKGHIQMPSARDGGILSGPSTGYQATLHGDEAVIPLNNNKTITAQSMNMAGSGEQNKLLAMELNKLDSMLNIMQKQNEINNRILMKQH